MYFKKYIFIFLDKESIGLDLSLILQSDLKKIENYFEFNNEEYHKNCDNFQMNIFKYSIPISKSQVTLIFIYYF